MKRCISLQNRGQVLGFYTCPLFSLAYKAQVSCALAHLQLMAVLRWSWKFAEDGFLCDVCLLRLLFKLTKFVRETRHETIGKANVFAVISGLIFP